MGNWYNRDREMVRISDMDDRYVNNLIGFVARGGGWSSEIVLGCLDELYAEAERRNILKGFWARALKRYTARLWRRIAKSEGTGEGIAWRTPRWVEKTLEEKVPFVEPEKE
jgi:hypothetical protein